MGDELEPTPATPAQQAADRTSFYHDRMSLVARRKSLELLPHSFDYGDALEPPSKDIFGAGDTLKSIGNGVINSGFALNNFLLHGAVGELTDAAGMGRPPKIELDKFSPLGPSDTHIGGVAEVVAQYLGVHLGAMAGGRYLKGATLPGKLFRPLRKLKQRNAFSKSEFSLTNPPVAKNSNFLGLKGSNTSWWAGARNRSLGYFAIESVAFDAQQPNLGLMLHTAAVKAGWDKNPEHRGYMNWVNELMIIPETLANNPDDFKGKEMDLVTQLVAKAKSLPESVGMGLAIEGIVRMAVIVGTKRAIKNTTKTLNDLDDEIGRVAKELNWKDFPASVENMSRLKLLIAGNRGKLIAQLDSAVESKILDTQWEMNYLRDVGYRADPAVKGSFAPLDLAVTADTPQGWLNQATHALNRSDAAPEAYWKDVAASISDDLPQGTKVTFRIATPEDIALTASRTSQGRGRVGALVRHGKNEEKTIIFDLEWIHKMWVAKAWNKPKAGDAVALPLNSFKDKDEFFQFLIEHEKAHIRFPKNKSEKSINKIALNIVKERRTKKGAMEPDPLKRPVVSVDFRKSPYAETEAALYQLDPRTGTIAMDHGAIAREWDEALKTGELPFLSGTKESTRANAFGPSFASMDMHKTLDDLGVDPKKLFEAFRALGGDVDGVRYYQKFLELRARHLLVISKREGVAVDLLGILHSQYSQFATEAVYNALTKSKSAGGLGFMGPDITRVAKPSDFIARNAPDKVKNQLKALQEADEQLVKEFHELENPRAGDPKPTDAAKIKKKLLAKRKALQKRATDMGIPVDGKSLAGVSIFKGLLKTHKGQVADNILQSGLKVLRSKGDFITVKEVVNTVFHKNGLENFVKIVKEYGKGNTQKGLDQHLFSSAGGGSIWNTRTQGSNQAANATFAGMYHVFNKHMNTVYTDPDTYARAMGWKGDVRKGIDRAKIGGDPSVRSTDYGETSKEFLQRKINQEFTLLARESGVSMTPRALKDQAMYGKGMFDNGEGGLKDISGGPRNSSGELTAIGDVRDLHVRVISARMLIQNTAADINTVAIKLFDKRQLLLAKGQDISAKEQVQFAEMLTRQLIEIDMLAQVKTASGRNLRAYQDLDKIQKYAASLNPEQEEEIYKQLLATLESSEGFSKVIVQLDVIVQQTKDSPTMGGRAAYVNALNRASILRASTGWNDLIKAHNDIWINSLLFNGQTQVVNLLSTGVNVVAGNFERYAGSFAPESWFKNQRDIFGEEMSAATAKQVARSHAMYESSYIAGVSWDILNLLFRGSDNFKASAANLDGTITGRAHDSLQIASDTMAALKNPEDNLLGGTHLDNQLRSGGEAQSQHIGAGLVNLGYRVGGATGQAVEMLGENKGVQTVAVLWDGFYKYYLRGGAKLTVGADQWFKRMTMQASAQGSLTAYAIEVKGMTNKKEIAEWVAERKTGLMLPNNQPFSEVNLRKLAQKTARDNGITNKEEYDGYVKWFVAKNTNFEGPDGRIIMTGPLREEMASKALDSAERQVFQQGLDSDTLALHIQAGGTEKNFGKINPATGAPYTPYGPTFSGRVAKFTNKVPLTKLVLPFVKTPVNLWKAIINRVPYLSKFAKQSLSDLRSGDPQRVAQVYGRQLTGMVLFGASYHLVKKGAVTGDLSNNPARRANEIAAGLRPWTITDSNGEQWNYSRMEWAATPLKIMAQYHETMQYLRDDPSYEGQWLDWGHAGIGTIAAVGVDSTYLRGMSEFLNLVRNMSSGDTQDSSKELMDVIEMRLASFIPKIPKDFMDAMDDTYRKHTRAGDALLVRIFPFGVPPLRDPITGRVIKKHRSYPHPLIHMLTPVKRYSHSVSSFIAQEMVSLHSFIQPIGKQMFENKKLKMHEAYANFDGPTEEMTAELRKKGADYRLPEHLGGAKCPVVGGQDYYDFLQQYISVRKVEFKNIGLINSSITVPAQDGENGARIAQLFADIKDNKKLSVKASLEDIIHTVVQMKSYQAIPIDSGVGKVSYRAQIIQGIVSKFRADAKAELLGDVIDIGTKYDPIEGKTGIYLPVYTGIITSFWPDLSKQASKENYQNLWKHQGKTVFESPASKSKQLQRINEETFGRPTPTKKK